MLFFSNCALLVPRSTDYIYVLIFCPVSLLNLLTSSSYFVDSTKFYTWMIILSANKENFTHENFYL